jgi:hypothetical protein
MPAWALIILIAFVGGIGWELSACKGNLIEIRDVLHKIIAQRADS